MTRPAAYKWSFAPRFRRHAFGWRSQPAVPAVALRSRRVLYGAAVLSALAEPAGAMTFVSIHELIPMARRYRHTAYFLGGIAASVIVHMLLARLTM